MNVAVTPLRSARLRMTHLASATLSPAFTMGMKFSSISTCPAGPTS